MCADAGAEEASKYDQHSIKLKKLLEEQEKVEELKMVEFLKAKVCSFICALISFVDT